MKTITNYAILSSHRLIIECFCGDIRPSDIISLKERALLDPEYDPAYNTLEDIRMAYMDHSREQIDELVRWLANNRKRSRNSAILTDNPQQVVAAELFVFSGRKLPMVFKVFSTLPEALNWVRAGKLPADAAEELIQAMVSVAAD